ncbi:hypothetical protein FACS1894199_05870 [Bacteroidia bacterium]|nr:hypothetical protein FACS1894199_05870 [Bacteroidia bacterium]
MMEDKKTKILTIIIIALSVIVLALFVIFMNERSKNAKHTEVIEHEKEVLTGELTDLSKSYGDLKTSNDSLSDKLLLEQEKITGLLREIKRYKATSYEEISQYKKEVGTLKTILRDYVVQIDSLNQLNQKLVTENKQVKKQSDWLRERNQKLEVEQKGMKEAIEIAAALTIENFTVTPINKNGKKISWKKCFQLRADFVIPKNVSAKRGTRTLYIRFKRPDGQVIAFSEKSFFKYQNADLVYSAKRDIEYEGERLETSIYWPNDGSLVKGTYTAELFSETELVGTTDFTL